MLSLHNVFLLVTVLLNFLNVETANILAIIPTPSYSHQVAFTELWKELSLHGHHVTVLTTDPRNDKNLTNLKEIDMTRSYDIWSQKYSFSQMAQEGLGFWNIWDFFLYLLSDICEDQLEQPEMQELIKGKDKYHFDLVIAEVFYPELLAFGRIYNCPTALVATIDSTIQMYQYLGNPVHPVLNSDINVPYFGSLTFMERVISTLFHWNQIYYEYFTFLPRKQLIVDRFFANLTGGVRIEQLIADIDLMLVNVSPLLKGSRALSPTTISVGGGNHLKPLKPLPKELKEFLDAASDGFIYLSLGGNVKSKDLNNETIQIIMQTFRELPYRVLWKFEADYMPGKPDNVKIIKWAPQQDILRHPNVKLFIMQGGIQSIEEAIFTHVPMIVMPFYGDQLKNARIVEYKKLGKYVNHKPALNRDEFKEAILEIIKDESYTNTVKKLAELILDQPMTGLETSIWWTEYLIRNKGAKQLRNPSSDLPIYQFYLLDVVGFLLASAFVAIYIIKVVLLRGILAVVARFFQNTTTNKMSKLKTG